MARNIKQQIGISVIFGMFFPLFIRLAKAFDYWSVVINNITFNADINGEYWLVDEFVKDEAVCIDVGFNMGDWSEYVIGGNPSAKVFAFDPCLAVIDRFKSQKKPLKNIDLIQLALSDSEGVMPFYDYGNFNGCNSLAQRNIDFDKSVEPNIYQVDITTLDIWTKKNDIAHIDLLKVDAEGYDLNVLEGANDLLDTQAVDVIMFEYASGWFCNKRFLVEAVDFLADKPYKLFKLFPSFLVPYSYRPQHEGKLFSMFVAISDRKLSSISTKTLIRQVPI